jgi:AcrR family transcriptional regulator
MPLIVDKDEEKRKILDALQNCLDVTPLARISLREIAKEAGFSHSKVLTYYESKDKLMEAFIEDRFEAYSNYVVSWFTENSVEKFGSLEKFFIEFLRHSISEGLKVEHMNAIVQLYSFAKYDEELRIQTQKSFDQLKYLLEITFKAYGTEPDKIKMYVNSAICFIEGFLICKHLDVLSTEEMLDSVIEYYSLVTGSQDNKNEKEV